MWGKSLSAGETVKLVKTQVKVQNACPPSHFPKLSIGTGVYWSLFLGRLWSLVLMIDTPVTLTQPNSVVGLFDESRLDPIYPAWTKHGIYKCTTHRPDMSWLRFLCSILMFFKGIFHQFNHKWYKKSHITMAGNSQLQNTNTYVVYSWLPLLWTWAGPELKQLKRSLKNYEGFHKTDEGRADEKKERNSGMMKDRSEKRKRGAFRDQCRINEEQWKTQWMTAKDMRWKEDINKRSEVKAAIRRKLRSYNRRRGGLQGCFPQ